MRHTLPPGGCLDSTFDLPEPTRTVRELPDLEAVRRAGIPDLSLDQARVVACAGSSLIGAGRARDRDQAYGALRLLARVGASEYVYNDHRVPPPHPHLVGLTVPGGDYALRRLGLSGLEVGRYWEMAQGVADDPCLPLEWLLEFIPGPFWPLLWTLIEWGPGRCRLALLIAARRWAQTPLEKADRRRPAVDGVNPPSSWRYVQNSLSSVTRLFEGLVRLRARLAAAPEPVLPLGLVESWTERPAPIDPRLDVHAAWVDTDTDGPDLGQAAAHFHHLAAAARRAPRRARFRLWRSLVSYGPFLVLGLRRGALSRLDVADYVPVRRFHGGAKRAALRVLVGKSHEPDEVFWLPLPREMAGWIEEWIEMTGRRVGQAGEPLFPAGDASNPNRRRPVGRWCEDSIRDHFSGREPAPGRNGCYAILPRDPANPFVGWSPHLWRHTTVKLADLAGLRLTQADPEGRAHIPASRYAEVLVSHKVEGMNYRNTNSRGEMERLTVEVVDEMWSIVWAEREPVLRGPDPEEIILRAEALRMASTAIAGTERQIDELNAHAEAVRARRRRAKEPSRQGDLANEVIDLMSEKDGLRDQHLRLLRAQSAAQEAYERACTQEVRLPPERYASEDDYQATLRAALEGRPRPEIPAEEEEPLAEELSVQRVALLYERRDVTIRRWRSGMNLPRDWKRRPLWRPFVDPETGGSVEPWHVHNKKDQRLRVEAINAECLDEHARKALLALRRDQYREDRAREAA